MIECQHCGADPGTGGRFFCSDRCAVRERLAIRLKFRAHKGKASVPGMLTGPEFRTVRLAAGILPLAVCCAFGVSPLQLYGFEQGQTPIPAQLSGLCR